MSSSESLYMNNFIDIVFDKLPGPEGCRFIEVENSDSQSIRFGEWVQRLDGYAALRISDGRPVADLIAALQNLLNGISTGALKSDQDEVLESAVRTATKAILKAQGK